MEMRGWIAEVRESAYQHRKGNLLSSLLCLSAGFALCSHRALWWQGFSARGHLARAGELTTPGICKIALQGNRQACQWYWLQPISWDFGTTSGTNQPVHVASPSEDVTLYD